MSFKICLTVFLGNDAEPDALFGSHVHHNLVESVVWRIVFPVNACIDVIGIFHSSCLSVILLIFVVRTGHCQEIKFLCLSYRIVSLFPMLRPCLLLFLQPRLFLFHDLNLFNFLTVLFPEIEKREHGGCGDCLA